MILRQLAESDPLPDKAGRSDGEGAGWNQHRAIAEEVILAELIYV